MRSTRRAARWEGWWVRCCPGRSRYLGLELEHCIRAAAGEPPAQEVPDVHATDAANEVRGTDGDTARAHAVNCQVNTKYGCGTWFEPSLQCYRDERRLLVRSTRVRLGAELFMGSCAGGGSSAPSRGTTRLRSLPGVTLVQEPPVSTPGLAGARADLGQGVQVAHSSALLPRQWWRGRGRTRPQVCQQRLERPSSTR